MRWISVVLIALICALLVYGVLSHPPVSLPSPSPELQTNPSPLVITIDLIPDSANPANWLYDSTQSAKIPLFVHYKNISNRNLLVSAGTLWAPGLQFACNSWFSSPTHHFFTITGELCWLLIKPGETATTPCDLSNYFTFETGGTYQIRYAINGEGAFSTRDTSTKINEPPNKFGYEDFKKYSTGSFKAYASGQLSVPATPAESSSGW